MSASAEPLQNSLKMGTIDFSKIKGVILDYGGTLDTDGTHWSHIIESAYKQAGVAVTDENFLDAYVNGERELARTLHILPQHDFADMLLIKVKIELQYLAEHGLFAPADIDSKAQGIAKICHEAAEQQTAKAAVVLKALAARWPLVLVSNFYGNLETVLSEFGIKQYFKAIVESAKVGVRKPDSKIFQLGLDALGTAPEETLVIGDDYKKDILPAKNLGCQTLWLKGKGWSADEEAQLHPDTISHLDEVLAFLAGA